MQLTHVRAAAAHVIYQVLERGISLSQALPDMQTSLKPQDHGLLAELCYGVLRRLPQLDKLVADQLQQPLKGKQRIIHHLLLVGVYQLYFTRIPIHASVSETVEASRHLKHPRLSNLINAVLREIERSRPELSQESDVLQFCHPKWLVNSIKKAYPEHWESILVENNQQAPMWLRNNSQKQTKQDYINQLQNHDIACENHDDSDAIYLSKPVSVSKLPNFFEGSVSVQDAAAQHAALLLNCQPDDHVLDACAAPGGKTCHILETQPNLQKIIALDINGNRLERVQENLDRLGFNATLIAGDATRFDTWANDCVFDRILLDAPCSATGVIRRHPDIKWLRRPEDINELSAVQAKILDEAWKYLKSGGRMVYATCSILPQENEQQIESFLSRTQDAKLIDIEQPSTSTLGWQILPGQNDMDGFYYAILQKK